MQKVEISNEGLVTVHTDSGTIDSNGDKNVKIEGDFTIDAESVALLLAMKNKDKSVFFTLTKPSIFHEVIKYNCFITNEAIILELNKTIEELNKTIEKLTLENKDLKVRNFSLNDLLEKEHEELHDKTIKLYNRTNELKKIKSELNSLKSRTLIQRILNK